MNYRIKELHDAAVRFLKTRYPAYEKDARRNDLIMMRLFNDTKAGKIKGFYLVNSRDFKAYHRSTKQPGAVQLSSGFYENGELIPCYDIQMETAADLIREGYAAGIYKEIA